jgi:glycerophosphoryl diester phosphodiesterase
MRQASPLIIAHRGASGYLPEHTLEAKALAYGQGAHFLEQDVVATGDDRLVVLHDIHLDAVTDVARRFPARRRRDGRFYARDFELAELRTLNVHERLKDDGGAVFPGRFPAGQGRFRIATLEEEIDLIQGLNSATGRRVGIYPEVKRPAWHRAEGIDLAAALLCILDERGYRSRTDPVYLQCFDAAELRRIRVDLDSDLKLVQLIGENDWGESDTDYATLKSPEGLAQLAGLVDAIGPWLAQLYALADIDGQPVSTGIVAEAQRAGLLVHPYTFRADAVPAGFASFAAMVDWFVDTLGVDGLFTDFPDLVRQAIEEAGSRGAH